MVEVKYKRPRRSQVKRPTLTLNKKREWKSAKSSLTTSGWVKGSQPIDWDMRQQLEVLRGRSRYEAQNNDHVKHFLRLVKTNVVGAKGVRLQGRVKRRSGRPDIRANDSVEESWQVWGKRGTADVTGLKSWNTICRECIEGVARDGEALYRKLDQWGNRFGFALEQLDPALLDIQYNESLGENQVIMGVEVDPWRRPVAYYFLKDRRDVYSTYYRERERFRVEARDMYHVYLPEWVHQTRGIPWASTPLERLHQLSGVTDAHVVGTRVGASKMGFYQQEASAGPYVGDDEDSHQNPIQDARPGEFEILPEGYTFNQFDPGYPNSGIAEFTKEMLRGVACGLGVNYNSLANDLEGVNYSSLRHGSLTERDIWMLLQDWFIEWFVEPVFNDWLTTAALNSAIVGPDGRPLPAQRVEDLRRVSWQPRRWQWVDPQKEIKANETAYNLRIRSISDIIREQGRDPDETFDEIARDDEKLRALNITPPSSGSNPQNEVPQDGDTEKDDAS